MENDKELLPNFCEQGLPEPPNEIVQNIGKINGTELQKVYTKEGFLGRGGFAQCHITYNKETDKRVATKIIPKTLLQAARTKLRLVNEIKLHNTLHHPNIVEFLTNFQDENYVYINLQLCESGSLCDLTQVRCDLTTPEVQSILYGLCQGLAYLHSRNIIHRDLKAGNIFLDEKNRVKIGDFGLATKLEFSDERKRTICGTPNYIAPEVLFGKGYHFQVDIWSIGVLIYTLYFTIPPFQTQDAYTTYQKIKRCDYIFPKYHDAPPEALDLIKKILVVNPAERITIEGILKHPFFKLGNGILDGLPDCIVKRPPNKKQISKWPKVVQVELPVKKAEPFEQTTNENTQMKSSFQNSLLYYPHEVSAVGNEKCYAMLFEEINPNIYFFCLNNANYGVMVKDKSYIFESNFIEDQENPGERRIKQMRINHSRKSEGLINGMPLSECEHRVLLSLKFKQINRLNLKFDAHLSTGIHISMFSQRKDLNILKFTNKYLQMILENNDGFVYQGQLHYCPSFSSSRDFYQINMEALMVAPGKENERAQPIPENIFNNPKYKKNPTLTCKKIAYASKFVQEVCLRKMARQI